LETEELNDYLFRLFKFTTLYSSLSLLQTHARTLSHSLSPQDTHILKNTHAQFLDFFDTTHLPP